MIIFKFPTSCTLICGILLLLTNQFIFSQGDISILEEELKTVQDTHRIRPLINLARLSYKENTSRSVQLAQEAHKLSVLHGHLWGRMQSAYQLAKAYGSTSEQELSIRWAKQSLAIFLNHQLYMDVEAYSALMKIVAITEKEAKLLNYYNRAIALYQAKQDTNAVSYVYLSIGKYYLYSGKPALSIQRYWAALSYMKDLNNPMQSALILNHMAIAYDRMGLYDSALVYYNKVKSVGESSQIPEIIVGSSMNISAYLNDMGQHAAALKQVLGILNISKKLPDQTLFESNLHIIGNCYQALGKYDSALVYFEKTAIVAKKINFHNDLCNVLLDIANVYVGQGRLNDALAYAIEANTVSIKHKVFSMTASSYYTMASIYENMGNLDKAKEFFLKASKGEQKSKQHHGYLNSTLRLANIHLQQKNYAESKRLYDTLLLMTDQKQRFDIIVRTYMGISQLALINDEIDEARHWIKSAVALSQNTTKSSKFFSKMYLIAGDIALKSKKYRESIQDYESSLKQANEASQKYIVKNCYKGLTKAYTGVGDYKLAMKYAEKHLEIQQVLYDAEMQYQTMELQTLFETQHKEQQIRSLEQEKEIKDLTLANQKTQIGRQRFNIFLLLLVTVLVFSWGLFFFNRYRLRQKNKRLLLESKQAQTAQQLKMAELRSDFFTNVSHEFRTPLTLLISPLKKLLKESPKEFHFQIDRAYRNASLLNNLIDETLDLSKLENGHLPLTPSTRAIGPFIEKIAQNFTSLAKNQKIKLEVINTFTELLVDFDENKLKKVFVNLLDNAFKHTNAGGKVSVEISSATESTITITIKDSGKGIAKEHLPNLFDRFYQVDHHSKGSGVGLALSKQLIQLHNGSISVQSEVEVGSCFTITLPLKNENTITNLEREASTSEKEATPNISIDLTGQKTILIIEDHDELRAYLKELLETEYTVLEAADGKEGIKMAEEKSPDLIISDVMMPYTDGLELTQNLKQNFFTSHIPIILLTAKASLDNKIKGLQMGADDYLAKPFDENELLHRSKNLILQREKLRALFTTHYFIQPQKMVQNKVDEEFLQKAIGIIEQHMENPDFSVDLFCKELSLNRTGVHVKLKALTGKNSSQFIKSIRIRRAARLLNESSKNIAEVSDMCGFGSRDTFNKAFREQFKLTPTEFRNSEGPIQLY